MIMKLKVRALISKDYLKSVCHRETFVELRSESVIALLCITLLKLGLTWANDFIVAGARGQLLHKICKQAYKNIHYSL